MRPFRSSVDKLLGKLGQWLGRAAVVLFTVFYGGVFIVCTAALCFGIVAGVVIAARAAVEHVVQVVVATDGDQLGRNLLLGSAVAAVASSWVFVRWHRQHAVSSRRRLGGVWLLTFVFAWSLMFVGSEALSWRPGAPTPTRLAAAPLPLAARPAGSVPTTIPAPPPVSVSGGTVCSDGWVSSSVGRGTCSRHGGIAGGSTSSSVGRVVDSGSALAAAPGPGLTAAPAIRTTPFPRVIATVGGAPPTDTVQALATPTVEVSATPSAASVTRSVYVSNTGGEGVFVRRTQDLADRLRAWPDGTRMEVLGDAELVSGTNWIQVRPPDGQIGFVPAQYLATLPPPSPTGLPTTTPPPTVDTLLPTSTAVQGTAVSRSSLESAYVSAGQAAYYPEAQLRQEAQGLGSGDLQARINRYRLEATCISAALSAFYPEADALSAARSNADAQMQAKINRYRLEATTISAALSAYYPQSQAIQEARDLVDGQARDRTDRFRLEATYISAGLSAYYPQADAVQRARTGTAQQLTAGTERMRYEAGLISRALAAGQNQQSAIAAARAAP